jgi:hypothetical protein
LNCYGLAKADAMASVRSLLAVALRKGQSGLLTYVSEFTAEAKASGLLKGAIESSGMRGVEVAS